MQQPTEVEESETQSAIVLTSITRPIARAIRRGLYNFSFCLKAI